MISEENDEYDSFHELFRKVYFYNQVFITLCVCMCNYDFIDLQKLIKVYENHR